MGSDKEMQTQNQKQTAVNISVKLQNTFGFKTFPVQDSRVAL